MKKILLSVVALSVVFATSCKKNDDNNSTPSNSWNINGKNHLATAVVYTSPYANIPMLYANDTLNNSFVIYFPTAPTANGIYHVAGVPIPQNNNDVFVAFLSVTGQFFSTDHSNTSVNVTINKGKISLSLPDTWLSSSSNAQDSIKVSANLTQQN